jgi:hypothetical protein
MINSLALKDARHPIHCHQFKLRALQLLQVCPCPSAPLQAPEMPPRWLAHWPGQQNLVAALVFEVLVPGFLPEVEFAVSEQASV